MQELLRYQISVTQAWVVEDLVHLQRESLTIWKGVWESTYNLESAKAFQLCLLHPTPIPPRSKAPKTLNTGPGGCFGNTRPKSDTNIFVEIYYNRGYSVFFGEGGSLVFFFTTLELFCKFIFHILAHWNSDALGFAKKKVCFSIIHGPTSSFSNI